MLKLQTDYYPKQIMYYLKNLPNFGALPLNEIGNFMAEIGSIEQGIKIKLYIKIENAIIQEIKYLVYGDGYIISALAKISETYCKKKLGQLQNFSTNKLMQELEIPPNNLHNIKLINQLVNKLVEQYKENRQ